MGADFTAHHTPLCSRIRLSREVQEKISALFLQRVKGDAISDAPATNTRVSKAAPLLC